MTTQTPPGEESWAIQYPWAVGAGAIAIFIAVGRGWRMGITPIVERRFADFEKWKNRKMVKGIKEMAADKQAMKYMTNLTTRRFIELANEEIIKAEKAGREIDLADHMILRFDPAKGTMRQLDENGRPVDHSASAVELKPGSEEAKSRQVALKGWSEGMALSKDEKAELRQAGLKGWNDGMAAERAVREKLRQAHLNAFRENDPEQSRALAQKIKLWEERAAIRKAKEMGGEKDQGGGLSAMIFDELEKLKKEKAEREAT